MSIESGDTYETEDGREVLVQFVRQTEDGLVIDGRYIAEDGSVDALAHVVIPKRRVRVRVSWTYVESRSTDLTVELTEDELEDLEAGYGFGDKEWAERVQNVEGADVEMLHDEVDDIEILTTEDEEEKEET